MWTNTGISPIGDCTITGMFQNFPTYSRRGYWIYPLTFIPLVEGCSPWHHRLCTSQLGHLWAASSALEKALSSKAKTQGAALKCNTSNGPLSPQLHWNYDGTQNVTLWAASINTHAIKHPQKGYHMERSCRERWSLVTYNQGSRLQGHWVGI